VIKGKLVAGFVNGIFGFNWNFRFLNEFCETDFYETNYSDRGR
jgi:hypothetical protein